MLNSKYWRQGRLGEILQLHVYLNLGVKIQDLADRTHKRAPLLLRRTGEIVSPDASAIKTGKFFFEFKTKSSHEKWDGGSKDDNPKTPPRTEEGINNYSYQDYLAAEQDWHQPVVLSILSIKEGELIATTLNHLEKFGKPRLSHDPAWPIINWNVDAFSRVAAFDPERLDRFFNEDEPSTNTGRERWLSALPRHDEAIKMLEWLGCRQTEFDEIARFVFDCIERDWK
jgi:hypothetical protein